MRALIAFLILVSAPFAYLSEPPHANVSAHNTALAPSFMEDGCLNESDADYDNPIKCAELDLLSAYPSVDSRISSGSETLALWRYAWDATSQDKTVTDSDGCRSYYHKTFQSAEVIANFSAAFRNQTRTIENVSENPVEIPFAPSELDETQGDNITLWLNGSIIFHYMFDRTVSSLSCDEEGCSCVSIVHPSEPMDIVRKLSSNLSYEVEGGQLLHFLAKPVLREQLLENSEFQDLAFTKRRFYLASLSLGNETFGSARFYEFYVLNDSLGVWRIFSHAMQNFTNLSESERGERTTPVPIEPENDTFTYIYRFDSGYQALGIHNLTLRLSDHFGRNFSQTFFIANRMPTFANTTAENGSTEISNSSVFRPSMPYEKKEFSLLVASTGALVALVVALTVLRK